MTCTNNVHCYDGPWEDIGRQFGSRDEICETQDSTCANIREKSDFCINSEAPGLRISTSVANC